jgi:hypothetical protein
MAQLEFDRVSPLLETLQTIGGGVTSLVPQSVKNLLRSYLVTSNAITALTLDEAFPNADKKVHFASQVIDLPAAHPKLSKELRHLYTSALDGGPYTTPEVFAAALPEVLFCPQNHVLLTADRAIIRESLKPPTQDGPPERTNYPFDPEALTVGSVADIEGVCTTFRCYFQNYYHTLIDNFPRLYLLHKEPWASIPEIKLLLADGPSPLEAFLIEKLCPPNVVVCPIDTGQLYQTDSFVFPSFLGRSGRPLLPGEYLDFVRSKLLPDRPPRRDKRIYISRQGTGTRRLLNAQDVIDRFRLEAYQLETLDIQTQIELFYDAELVVAPHGAGLANLIFCPRGTSVLELYPTPPPVRASYYYLSTSLHHDYQLACGSASHKDQDFNASEKMLTEISA